MTHTLQGHRPLNPCKPATALVINGEGLTIPRVIDVSYFNKRVALSSDACFEGHLAKSVAVLRRALEQGAPIYGVNTRFGGMATATIPHTDLSALQHNLLLGLKCGIGRDLPPQFARAAMLIRCNTLSRGASGIRKELISRLVSFLNNGVTPILADLGSIGASGDLIPLSSIAGALIGLDPTFRVYYRGEVTDCLSALDDLRLKPISLDPKEGLALVNGTSVSAAMAAIAIYESGQLLDLALSINALLCSAMATSSQPFDEFVHRMKPHQGQQQVAARMRALLAGWDGAPGPSEADLIQDRYSIRCIPQYFGPLLEGLRAIEAQIETELNACDDNPLIDIESERILQAGNFYGQYIGIGMDQLRQYLALIAKQIDSQISLLVMPEFNRGLAPCLAAGQGASFGLKGLQIYMNSVLPRLLHLANPVVTLYPTHAEQFNQNINSQSFNAAVLTHESISLLKYHLAAALIFAAQGVDLRAEDRFGMFLGSRVLGRLSSGLYEAVYTVLGKTPSPASPLVSDQTPSPIDSALQHLVADLTTSDSIILRSVGAASNYSGSNRQEGNNPCIPACS
jgi:phenylalanine ammonia-lyase